MKALCILVLSFFASCCIAQPALQTATIHFSASRIPIETLTPNDYLTHHVLTPKSNLFVIAQFEHPLTYYKQQLAPTIPKDSLFKIGNYQFTAYVDGKQIYQSNLLPGAPSAKSQDNDVVLNRPLVDNIDGQGSWSESFWNRFMANGGETALSDGRHVFKMEIRAYVKLEDIKVGDIIASGEVTLDVALHPVIDVSKIELAQITAHDGFEISKDAFDKTKIRQLKGEIEAGVFKKINSIVVLKDGKILIEEYFNGEDRNTLHDPRSVGKSFSSTIAGIAIGEGLLKSEKQPVSDFYDFKKFDNYNEAKTSATLEELLTMSSGFEGNDEDARSIGNEENMYPTSDWVKFALDLPYRESLKQHWHYFTAGVIVLGDILNKTVPGGLERYADEKLFLPLGIRGYKWQYTPQHVPNTAGGIQMRAIDFAKYGQLYKNKGMWNGKRVLPKKWVRKTFTKQRKIDGRDNEYYGYLFWNKMFGAKDNSYEAFYCAGNGGNYIIVFDKLPLVVVVTASAYGQPYAHAQVARMLSDYILPAIAGSR